MKIRNQKLVYVVTDVICDVCGQSCLRDPQCAESFEYGTLKAEWGYFSNKDLTREEGDICESCFDKVRVFIESLGGKLCTEEYSPCS